MLYQLALSPVDLLPVTREDVEKASVQQTRQLLKEDIDFYLDSKCEKLELRRQGLLAEVARVLFKVSSGIPTVREVAYFDRELSECS